jgi:hypothetical protein
VHPYMIEQVASQRTDEMRSSASTYRAHLTRRGPRHPIRHQTGWALVEIGLRLVRDSGGKP